MARFKLYILLALSGCAAAVTCPVPKHYTNAQRSIILAEIKSAPPESIMPQVIMDYEKLRREADLCNTQKTWGNL